MLHTTTVRSTSNTSPMRVAVIGAGWSGLAAAVTLVDAGAKVSLFEAGRRSGGRARRADIDELALDNGQHLLIGAYRDTLSIMRRVGIDPGTVLHRMPMRVLVPGVFDLHLPRLPAPLHAGIGLLRARGIHLAEKWAAIRAMRRLQASAYRLPADMPLSDWLDLNAQTGVLRRYLWESLCLAALNTPAHQASAQVFANVLRDTLGATRAATDFLLPTCTLDEVLPAGALRWLSAQGANIHLGTRIRGMHPHNTGWRVTLDMHANEETESPLAKCTGAASQAGGLGQFDATILAVAPQHLTTLLPESPRLQALRDTLSAFEYQPIATAYTRYPRGTRLPERILSLPGPLAQWVIDRGALAGGRPDAEASDGLFAHVLSAKGVWQSLDNDALGEALHAELTTALAGSQPPSSNKLPAPLSQRVVREQRATFACTPGLARPDNATALRGLWLAGDYTASDYPATLEAAVRSGIAAANGLLAEASPAA